MITKILLIALFAYIIYGIFEIIIAKKKGNKKNENRNLKNHSMRNENKQQDK